MAIILIIGIVFIVIFLMLFAFKPVTQVKLDFKNLLISRTTISILLAILIFLFSWFYNEFFWSSSHNLIEDLVSLPFTIFFAFGFGYGGVIAIPILLLEILFMSFIIRFFISTKWIRRLKDKTHYNIK